MPFRVCLKNTGPLDSSIIKKAKIGVSQDSKPRMIMIENTMSKLRFKKAFMGSSKGISLKESTGM